MEKISLPELVENEKVLEIINNILEKIIESNEDTKDYINCKKVKETLFEKDRGHLKSIEAILSDFEFGFLDYLTEEVEIVLNKELKS